MIIAGAGKDTAVLIFVPAGCVMNGMTFAAGDDLIFRMKSAMAVWTSKGYRSHFEPSYTVNYRIFRNFCQYRNHILVLLLVLLINSEF